MNDESLKNLKLLQITEYYESLISSNQCYESDDDSYSQCIHIVETTPSNQWRDQALQKNCSEKWISLLSVNQING